LTQIGKEATRGVKASCDLADDLRSSAQICGDFWCSVWRISKCQLLIAVLLSGQEQRSASPEWLRFANTQRDISELKEARIAGGRQVCAPGNHIFLPAETGFFRDPQLASGGLTLAALSAVRASIHRVGRCASCLLI
jgi:hypothetical protein